MSKKSETILALPLGQSEDGSIVTISLMNEQLTRCFDRTISRGDWARIKKKYKVVEWKDFNTNQQDKIHDAEEVSSEEALFDLQKEEASV